MVDQRTHATRANLAQRKPGAIALPACPVAGHEELKFHMRRFGGVERDQWDIWCLANCWDEDDAKAGRGKSGLFKPGVTFRAQLVALTLCDAGGKLFYDPRDPGDVAEAASLDGELLVWLYRQARRINGFAPESEEELAKNSDSVVSGATGSGSRPSSDAPSESVSPA